jgi:hypothetical protein
MEQFQRIKVLGKGSFGSAILVRRDAALFVMKVRAARGARNNTAPSSDSHGTLLPLLYWF